MQRAATNTLYYEFQGALSIIRYMGNGLRGDFFNIAGGVKYQVEMFVERFSTPAVLAALILAAPAGNYQLALAAIRKLQTIADKF